MTNLKLFGGIAAVVMAISGCSLRPESGGALPPFAQAASAVPAVTITGTYDGSLKETEGSHSRSGTCKITLNQSGKTIKGTADVHFDSGKSYKFTLAGSIKSNGKKSAKLSIKIIDDKGSSADGIATIKGRTLRGKASAQGTKGTAYLTFTAKRKGAV